MEGALGCGGVASFTSCYGKTILVVSVNVPLDGGVFPKLRQERPRHGRVIQVLSRKIRGTRTTPPPGRTTRRETLSSLVHSVILCHALHGVGRGAAGGVGITQEMGAVGIVMK